MSVVGLATTVFIESPHDVAAQSAAPPATTLSAVARWQVLREAITVQGIVRSSRMIKVTARAPYATVTLTQLPVKPGDRVRPGQVIAQIDGRPVMLLRGRLPAYRNLHVGDHGPDVAQLQRALQGLGYADFDSPGYFGQSTALALLMFYRHLGYDAPVYHRRLRRATPQAGPAVSGIANKLAATELVIPSAYLPRNEVSLHPRQVGPRRLGRGAGRRSRPQLGGADSRHRQPLCQRSSQPASGRAGTPGNVGTDRGGKPAADRQGDGDQDRHAAHPGRPERRWLPGPGQAAPGAAAADDRRPRPADADRARHERPRPHRAGRGHPGSRAWAGGPRRQIDRGAPGPGSGLHRSHRRWPGGRAVRTARGTSAS